MGTLFFKRHPETTKFITPSSSTEGWSTIRVETEPVITTVNNLLQVRKRTAFLRGRTEDLEMILKMHPNQQMEGYIRLDQSYVPFYEGQKPVINPETNEIMKKNGRMYYQQYIITNQKEEDQLLPVEQEPTTKIDAVKAADVEF